MDRKRVYRRGKRAVFGAPAPLPASLLPDEVEKALRELGDDGTKVRGTLERDFAAYAKQAQRDRASVRTLLLLTVARPLLTGATNAVDEVAVPDRRRGLPGATRSRSADRAVASVA